MHPNLINKRFTDLSNNNILTVKDQFENIVILDNGHRIDAKRLLDPNYFDEYIDPKNFFGDTYNVFAEKIKSVDLSLIKDEEPMINDSAIIEVDPEQERREMEQKARDMSVKMNPGAAAQKQAEMLMDILGENGDGIKQELDVANIDNQQQPHKILNNQDHIRQVEKMEDPIITMFKNVKRKEDFSFTLSVDGKIPRLDFIEMMEDSYETSIIEFLADEFTKNLMSNPQFIKDKIIQKINSMVYGESEKQKGEAEEVQILTDVSDRVLEPINDGTTQIKASTKPKSRRTKKETSQVIK